MTYPIFRSDAMSGTTDVAKLRTGKYMPGNKAEAIANGSVVEMVELMDGDDKKVWKVVAPTSADVEKAKLAIVGTPELTYDERLKNLDDFTNPADGELRLYLLVSGNIFSVTSDGFTAAGEVKKGDVVEIVAGATKLNIPGAEATEGATVIGKIADIDNVGSKTYYAVDVA